MLRQARTVSGTRQVKLVLGLGVPRTQLCSIDRSVRKAYTLTVAASCHRFSFMVLKAKRCSPPISWRATGFL